jgi:hypothetical protein
LGESSNNHYSKKTTTSTTNSQDIDEFPNNRKDKKLSKTLLLQKHSHAKIESFQNSIQDEILKFNDIVLASFVDSYINNTIKTMMGIRFSIEKCSNFQYAFLVDDDMHINLKNLKNYLESPREYPFNAATFNSNNNDHEDVNFVDERRQQVYCNTQLYAGKVLKIRPVRYKFGLGELVNHAFSGQYILK